MRLRFVYAGFRRHADDHPELREHVPCDEYLGPPSLGIACLASVTPDHVEIDLRDDRVEDVGFDDPLDLVAISCFTPSSIRAMEIADGFRERGVPVVMGGIFPTMVPHEAAAHADAIVLGEGEAVWPRLLEDAARGELSRVYRGSEPFDLDSAPLPRTDLYARGGAHDPDDYPVQVHRGCALRCSACALPTSMGRFVRHYPVDHVLGQIDQLEARGKLASFTEDTSFLPASGAQRRFVEVLDALEARGREAAVSYVGISAPLVLVAPDELLARVRRAGVRMFYFVGGFDPVTRGAFTGRDPKARQRFLDSIRKCRDHGIEPYTSFLVGNDGDDAGTFDRMLEAADEAGIRKAEFAIRTPYPGTPDHGKLREEGRLLHTDWSRYNDANVVFEPAQMTPDELTEGYLYLWRELYRSRGALAALDHRERTIQF